jgi:hypothetical protein
LIIKDFSCKDPISTLCALDYWRFFIESPWSNVCELDYSRLLIQESSSEMQTRLSYIFYPKILDLRYMDSIFGDFSLKNLWSKWCKLNYKTFSKEKSTIGAISDWLLNIFPWHIQDQTCEIFFFSYSVRKRTIGQKPLLCFGIVDQSISALTHKIWFLRVVLAECRFPFLFRVSKKICFREIRHSYDVTSTFRMNHLTV